MLEKIIVTITARLSSSGIQNMLKSKNKKSYSRKRYVLKFGNFSLDSDTEEYYKD